MSQAYNPYGMRRVFNPQQSQQYITCFIDDGGKIMIIAPDGPKHIGWTSEEHDALQKDYDSVCETGKQYYEALSKDRECPNCGGVVPALLRPELTQEEVIERQGRQLAEAQAALETNNRTLQLVLDELKALKGEKDNGISGADKHGRAHTNGSGQTESANKGKGSGSGKQVSGDK